MKYLLVLVVLLVAIHVWRSNRRDEQQNQKRSAPRPSRPAPMVACAVCGTHLPATEAVHGRTAAYCCQAHRLQAEQGGK